MNTLTNLDFKVSPTATSVSRSSASSAEPDGADFSATFRESLAALSREDTPPKTDSAKTADSPKVMAATENKPEDKIQDKSEDEPEGASDSGQNLPVVVAMVPANLASVPPVAVQPVVLEETPNTVVLTGDLTAQSGPLSMPVSDSAKGLAQAAWPKVALPLGQVQVEASQAAVAAKAVTADLATTVFEAATAQAGLSQGGATPQVPSQTQIDAGAILKSEGAASVQAQAPAAMVVESAKAGRAEAAIATAKPVAQTSSVDSIGSANQALLQARHSEQLLAAAPKPVMPDEAESAQTVGAEPEQNPLLGMGLAKDDAKSGVIMASPVGTQMAAPMRAEVSAASMPAADPAALQQPSGLKQDTGLLDKAESAPKAAGESLFPGLGASPVLSGHGAVTSPVMHSSSSHTPTPVMMVPAAQLNGEIIKFAGGGGGRAVMEITSPDLGALKIDLSIDGRGVARMVVEASTGAARDQLEQGLRHLHDDFGALGLSLNVDVRQGGGNAYQRDLPSQNWGGASANAGSASSDGFVPATESRVVSAGGDKTLVHFYA